MNNEQFKQLLKEKLTEKRYFHSLCVADSAKMLAEKYGGNVEKAYFTGLIHDIMKDADKNEQLHTIKSFGIILDSVEKNAPKLWHAISGYVYLQTNCGVTDTEILNAVRYHTTAKKNMNLLEKIVYVADFISADRTYEGVENIRKIAEKSLEEAVFEGIYFTINDLVINKKAVHKDTFEAFNQIVNENRKEDVL